MYFSPLRRALPGNSQNVNLPFASLDQAIHDFRTGERPVPKTRFASPTTLTISGGVITIDQSYHLVDTQGAASSDDLDTINGSAQGDVLLLQNANASRSVVVKHNTGNIFLSSATDFTLSGSTKALLLFRVGSVWSNVRAQVPALVETVYPWTELGADGTFDVTFTGVYQRLRIYYNLRSSDPSGDSLFIRLNNDSGANYNQIQRRRNVTGDTLNNTTGAANFSHTLALPSTSLTYFAPGVMDIFNADAGFAGPKTVQSHTYVQQANTTTNIFCYWLMGSWENTADAVSRILFRGLSVANLEQGSGLGILGWR